MRMMLNKNSLIEALTTVQVKGKYLSSHKLKNEILGEYVKIFTKTGKGKFNEGIYFMNASHEMAVMHYLPYVPNDEIDAVFEIDKLLNYVSKMEASIILDIDEVCKISSGSKTATIPLAISHPQEIAINIWFKNLTKCEYSAEIKPIVCNDIEYNNIVKLNGRAFKKIIQNCDTVGSGIYRLHLEPNSLKIHCSRGYESYEESMYELNTIGEEIGVVFTSPIYVPFETTNFNMCLSNDGPLLLQSNNTILIRAPYIDN